MKKADFNKLKAKWYKRLEQSGFRDIEQDEIYFKAAATSIIDKRRVTWAIQAEYYSMAREFLNDYKFANPLDKAIWAQHADSRDGISEAFLKKFNKRRKYKIIKMTAWRIVQRLELIMKKQYGVIK
jgi:hypothetical protein